MMINGRYGSFVTVEHYARNNYALALSKYTFCCNYSLEKKQLVLPFVVEV